MIAIENISSREEPAGSSRRNFLRGIAGAGAFVLAVRYLPFANGEELLALNSSPGMPTGVADVASKGPLSPNVSAKFVP